MKHRFHIDPSIYTYIIEDDTVKPSPTPNRTAKQIFQQEVKK